MKTIKEGVVAVVVPTTNAEGIPVVGTGCSVSDDLVLTARHVVFPSDRDLDKPIRIYWNAGHGTSPEDRDRVELALDCIAWDGEEAGLGAVLLKSPRPKHVRGVPTARFASIKPSRECRWQGRGYPAAATPSGSLAPTDFNGIFLPPIKRDHFFQVTVDAPPSSEQNWQGASGMAIVSDEGMILGLAYEVPHNFGAERAHVVPAWRLFEDDGFKECLGSDKIDYEAFRADMQEKIAQILQDCEPVDKKLADRYKVTNKSDKEERTRETAARIVDSDPEELLNHLYQIKYKEPGMHDTGAEALSAVMHAALPILDDLYVHDVAQLISRGMSFAVVELNVAMRTVAEIAMARFEGKIARFATVGAEEADVPGELALAKPPTPGRDSTGAQVQRDITASLAALLETNPAEADFEKKFRDYLDEIHITGEMRSRIPEDDLTARIHYINKRLKVKLRNEERRYYYAAIIPNAEPQRSASLEVLESLRNTFPDIVFLALAPDPFRPGDEMERYGNVADLCRDDKGE
ncbi:MAG: trypsin-like peptidase domain-containing protein [Magnetococcales bacterium]|nr:trypsin-like peptidase domain-containing protein [Magnetococcales bacterium]